MSVLVARPSKAPRRTRRKRLTPIALMQHAALLAIALVFLVPMLWVLSASIDAQATFAIQWPHFSWVNFQSLFTPEILGHPLTNSLILATSTTVAPPSEEAGRAAFEMLIAALRKGVLPPSITLPVRLVVRESTANLEV